MAKFLSQLVRYRTKLASKRLIGDKTAQVLRLWEPSEKAFR